MSNAYLPYPVKSLEDDGQRDGQVVLLERLVVKVDFDIYRSPLFDSSLVNK